MHAEPGVLLASGRAAGPIVEADGCDGGCGWRHHKRERRDNDAPSDCASDATKPDVPLEMSGEPRR